MSRSYGLFDLTYCSKQFKSMLMLTLAHCGFEHEVILKTQHKNNYKKFSDKAQTQAMKNAANSLNLLRTNTKIIMTIWMLISYLFGP